MASPIAEAGEPRSRAVAQSGPGGGLLPGPRRHGPPGALLPQGAPLQPRDLTTSRAPRKPSHARFGFQQGNLGGANAQPVPEAPLLYPLFQSPAQRPGRPRLLSDALGSHGHEPHLFLQQHGIHPIRASPTACGHQVRGCPKGHLCAGPPPGRPRGPRSPFPPSQGSLPSCCIPGGSQGPSASSRRPEAGSCPSRVPTRLFLLHARGPAASAPPAWATHRPPECSPPGLYQCVPEAQLHRPPQRCITLLHLVEARGPAPWQGVQGRARGSSLLCLHSFFTPP